MQSCCTNYCSLPPWVIASRHFNRYPKPLELQGVRRGHAGFFRLLDAETDPRRRTAIFHDYMDVTFQLHQWQQQKTAGGRKSLKNSYLRFLRGWMFDANGREGAVLKGWVESRFGLAPTYHGQPIASIQSEAYQAYLIDRMRGSARSCAIQAQFDLLFEFAQYELQRRHAGQTLFEMYRGIYDFAEHPVLEQQAPHHCVVRLNNLNSFTSHFERAWEFGSRVLAAKVPASKILFFSGLFCSALLRGEEENLVIGGEYKVEIITGGFR